MADAVGDIVAGNIEDAAIIEHAPDDDVGVRVARVVMVDRDPVEAGGQIQFHLAHEVAGEAAKISHFGCILRRDDEPKLVAISPTPLHKGLAVGLVLESGIGLAPFAIARDPVPLEIAEMGVHGPAHRSAHLRSSRAPLLRIEPDHPGLDDDPPRSKPARGSSLPAPLLTRPRKGGHDLRTSATRVEPTRPASFPATGRAHPLRIATCLADCDLDLLEERLRPRIDACSTVA
jgi:hypothetical protein